MPHAARRAAAAALLSVAALAACASNSGVTATSHAPIATEGTPAPTTTVPATPPGTTEPELTLPDTVPFTAPPDTATSDTVGADGVFTDPQGAYTMRIDPSWPRSSNVALGDIEDWGVAPATNGFTPNVNVLTQDTQGMDLQAYLDFSTQHMGEFHLVGVTVVTGTNGNALGRLEYTGSVTSGATSVATHFLATVDVQHGQAVVATLTVQETAYVAVRAAIEPYLLTLQAL